MEEGAPYACVLMRASRAIWSDTVAKLNPTTTEVFAELCKFFISRWPIFLDWPLCAAPCNELLVVPDHLGWIGGRVSTSRIQVIVTRELRRDVDRQTVPNDIG